MSNGMVVYVFQSFLQDIPDPVSMLILTKAILKLARATGVRTPKYDEMTELVMQQQQEAADFVAEQKAANDAAFRAHFASKHQVSNWKHFFNLCFLVLGFFSPNRSLL